MVHSASSRRQKIPYHIIYLVAAGCRVLLPPPYPLPPSAREGGELKLPSTMKLIDETNRSLILYPLSLIPIAADAESSSRPLTPSPLCEGGGGAEITFDYETHRRN